MKTTAVQSLVVALFIGTVACGDDGTGSGGSSSGGSSSGGESAGGESNGGGTTGGAGGMASGGAGGMVAASEPMGIDCTDTCPSFEGRTYVCTFLPGFPANLGYCSLECSAAAPTGCIDTEPGEVYCNADAGRCVIGCPFDACPNGMDCSFDFNNEPACKPTP